MKKAKFTKSFALMLTALLLLSMIIFCVACNQTPEVPDTETPDTENPDPNIEDDPFAGDYKEVPDDEREIIIAKTLQKIEDLIENNPINNFKIVRNLDVTYPDQIEVRNEVITVDTSTTLIEEYYKFLSDKKTSLIDAKIWINAEYKNILYQITNNGIFEQGTYSEETTFNEYPLTYIFQINPNDILLELLIGIKNPLNNNKSVWYINNNHIKILLEEQSTDSNIQIGFIYGYAEYYFIFEQNGNFKIKIESTEKFKSKSQDEELSTANVLIMIESSYEIIDIPNLT